MRVFLQGRDESIVINDEISVTVLDIDGDEAMLAIHAPDWVEIDGNEPSRSKDALEEWSPLLPR